VLKKNVLNIYFNNKKILSTSCGDTYIECKLLEKNLPSSITAIELGNISRKLKKVID
jgi:hypothetical protein